MERFLTANQQEAPSLCHQHQYQPRKEHSRQPAPSHKQENATLHGFRECCRHSKRIEPSEPPPSVCRVLPCPPFSPRPHVGELRLTEGLQVPASHSQGKSAMQINHTPWAWNWRPPPPPGAKGWGSMPHASPASQVKSTSEGWKPRRG